jgi:hypothetical protein
MEQLAELRRGLALKPQEVDLTQLIPLLVPSSFFDSQGWPGPYSLLRAGGLGLTWAVMMPRQTMRYVDHELADYWESQNLDWRHVAGENLARMTGDPVATGQLLRDDGSVYALVMMHEDGCGPSRLLFDKYLFQMFPEGYRVAIPEMSVGLAISVNLSETQEKKIESIVSTCFERGTRPVSPLIYGSKDLVAA